jgi:hypothetical protein
MSDATIDDLSTEQLAAVVELQRVELNRLLGEQRRLNDRIDKLLDLQEREQVLRQQMQGALDRLAEQRMAAPPAETGTHSATLLIEDRLKRSERRFAALRTAVGHLVILLERQRRSGDAASV